VVKKKTRPTISYAEYLMLYDGISILSAKEIIGGDGIIVSQSTTGDEDIVMLQFEGEGSVGANAVLMFRKGK
jgi:hypothetical protein